MKRADLDAFKQEATSYLNNLENPGGESEEHLKGFLKDFLQNAFYIEGERLVYELYGLNEEEIGIVEGSVG